MPGARPRPESATTECGVGLDAPVALAMLDGAPQLAGGHVAAEKLPERHLHQRLVAEFGMGAVETLLLEASPQTLQLLDAFRLPLPHPLTVGESFTGHPQMLPGCVNFLDQDVVLRRRRGPGVLVQADQFFFLEGTTDRADGPLEILIFTTDKPAALALQLVHGLLGLLDLAVDGIQ